MTKIKTLINRETSETYSPRTHINAVYDDNGNTLDSLLGVQNDKLTELDLKVFTGSNNLFNIDTAVDNTSISPTNGTTVTVSNCMSSDFIKVKPLTAYTYKGRWTVAWYDENKAFISGSSSSEALVKTLTSPDGAAFMRFSFDAVHYDSQTMMVNEGTTLLPFEEYGEQFNPEYLNALKSDIDSRINKKVFAASNNLFNIDTAVDNTSISSTNGTTVTVSNYISSDFIEVKPLTAYTYKGRWTVAWYDENKAFISGSSKDESSVKTLTSPDGAAFMRFSFYTVYYDSQTMMVNEGTTLLPFEEYGEQFNPEYLENLKSDIDNKIVNIKKSLYGLDIQNIKLSSDNLTSESKNLCLIAAKVIWDNDKTPDYTAFLFLELQTQKLYVSTNTPDNPEYLCDWNASLASGEECQKWMPTITATGDIIFLRDHARRNPIIYPHDNYSEPYVVDFGSNIAPYGPLMSGSITQFADGSFVFGDYAYHSLDDEENGDPRIIWKVSAPYNNPDNWVKAHSFKHVYFSSAISDEPDNEIGHIHAVVYDWYADVLYCTTGDIDRHCRLWKSLDKGNTWSAIDGAVGWVEGDSGTGNTQTVGQKWRFTGILFTEDACYWCTDSFFQYHCMYKALRGEDGVIVADSLEKVEDLEINIDSSQSQATYVSILTRNPYGILIIDRAEPRTDGILDVKFYDFKNKALSIVATLNRAATDASGLDRDTRIGLPNQFATLYQPESLDYVLIGGATFIRPNNTSLFNNSLDNYVGALKLRVR